MNTTKLCQIMSAALCMSCLFPLAANAQDAQIQPDITPDSEILRHEGNPNLELEAAKTTQTRDENADTATRNALLDALQAEPPKRAGLGANFAQVPAMLETIEKWIAGSVYDDPRQLVLRDILAGMPPQIRGPLMIQLAKKCREPELQKHWDRYLRPYPKAYAQVLTAWLKISQADPIDVERLLGRLAEFYPQQAIGIWMGLVENNRLQSLARLGLFARPYPEVTKHIIQRLSSLDALDDEKNETAILRLMRVLHHLAGQNQALSEELEAMLAPVLAPLLADSRVSRRIVALELLGDYAIGDLSEATVMRFEKAQNTSEKAFALRALALNDPQNQAQRLKTCLNDSDPTLRLEAASQLAQKPQLVSSELPQLKKAFDEETWPEIRQNLYAVIITASKNANERIKFQKSVALNNQIDPQTRLLALAELSQNQDATLSLDELKILIIDKAPLDIIAMAAEHIYLTNPQARPKLQEWLIAQMPLERRLSVTLARFVAAHNGVTQEQFHKTLQTICDKTEENPGNAYVCLHYFRKHSTTPEDQKRLEMLDALAPSRDIFGEVDDF